MSRPGDSGFSLLELLVTLFIIVLVTSVVTFNLSSGGREVALEGQVRELADTAVYALDEAQMSGADFGLLLRQFEHDGETVFGYDWRELRDSAWIEPESGKEIFSRRYFPPNIELQLELEDVLVGELPLAGELGTGQPQVILFASGETVTGALDIRQRDGDVLWRAEWDLLGRFQLLRRNRQGELELVDEDEDE